MKSASVTRIIQAAFPTLSGTSFISLPPFMPSVQRTCLTMFYLSLHTRHRVDMLRCNGAGWPQDSLYPSQQTSIPP